MIAAVKRFKARIPWKYLIIGYVLYNAIQIGVLFYLYSPSELLDMYLSLIKVGAKS
jgi:hypothetical protein